MAKRLVPKRVIARPYFFLLLNKMKLTKQDKETIKNGPFKKQILLLMSKWDNDEWIREARKYQKNEL